MLSVFAGKTIHSIAIKKLFFVFFELFWLHMKQVFGCFGCLMDIKEHFGCQQTQIFSMNGFSTLTKVGWLCWGLTSQSTIFQSCRDGAIASWVINQYFRGVKCLAQGHNTAAVGLEPRTSRSGVRHSTTEPPRSPLTKACQDPSTLFARCSWT